MLSATSRVSSFSQFPEFTHLDFANRKAFESYVADFPPISDLSFATMMMWWNSLDNAAVSLLNDNLVISYWLPGDDKKSGLCLAGTHKVDESLCAIFDYQKEQGEEPRIMHVPEKVIENIEHPELFDLVSERSFDEYIITVSNHFPLQNLPAFRRMRIRKFLSKVSKDRVVVRSIDLDDPQMQTLLLDNEKAWHKKGTINRLYKFQGEAFEYTVKHASLIGVDNLCLFIDGYLEGFCLFQWTGDRQYVILHHARHGYTYPRTFDYMVYAFAEWFSEKGVQYGNLEMDLGLPLLRMVKVALRPVNFFRKYTIRPVDN